jgi:small subunit ribosomal protein S1
LNVNDKIESKIINVDRKNRVISLSIRAKDIEDEQESLREFNRNGEDVATATLGDLLKAKMESRQQ